MQNGYKALLSNSRAGCGQLVKMKITLEPHVFWSNFTYLYMLTLSGHWYANQRQDFAEHPSGRLGHLVKRLITLEPHDILHNLQICTITVRPSVHPSVRPSARVQVVIMLINSSWTSRYFDCILVHINTVLPLASVNSLFDERGFAEHPVIRPWSVMKNVHI